METIIYDLFDIPNFITIMMTFVLLVGWVCIECESHGERQ